MARLREIVRQVKPVQETYRVDHVERVQNLLYEAKSTASTLFEGVIADCANLSGKNALHDAKTQRICVSSQGGTTNSLVLLAATRSRVWLLHFLFSFKTFAFNSCFVIKNN